MKDSISNKLNDLSSDAKKKLVMVAVALVILPILYTFLNNNKTVTTEQYRPVVSDPLLGTKTDEIGVNALANKITQESRLRVKENQEFAARLYRIEQSLDLRDDSSQKQSHRLKTLLRKTISELDTRKIELDKRLDSQVRILERQRMEFEKRLAAVESKEPAVITLNPGITQTVTAQAPVVDDGPKTVISRTVQEEIEEEEESVQTSKEAIIEDDWEMFEGATTSGFSDPVASNGYGQPPEGGAQVQTAGKFVTLGADGEEVVAQSAQAAKDDPTHYLPAGAIIRGTLLSGMDAPTYDVASARPYPVTLRVKHNAILPNKRTMDLKECFIIGSGFGELSSERAMIRGELLSCINADGGVIEVPIDSYAVGSDGKLGVRGRLVSKQGQILAAAMKAGFVSGVARAFSGQQVPSFNDNASDGDINYQFPNPGDVAAVGFTGGATQALEKLAEFYMKMAEKIFPIIEVDGGRTVTFITNKGIELKLKRG